METFWHFSRDGLRLRVVRWVTRGAVRGEVLLVHGHGEHAVRHGDTMEVLADEGWRVTGWDLRGHGRSSGRRGWMASYGQFLDDAREICRDYVFATVQGGRPVFLFGHSMGAQLALRLALDEPGRFTGIVASAPWLRLRVSLPAWKSALAAWAGRHAPWLTLSTGLKLKELTSEPQIRLPAAEAALLHRRMSARMFHELQAGAAHLLEHAGELSTPCLIIQGQDDPIMEPGAARDFAGALNGPSRLVVLPGVRHEPHNDPRRSEVLRIILDWFAELGERP